MAITAAGKFVPPYVVFTSVYVYLTWIEEGSDGIICRLRWFDGPAFEDWIDRILLPYFRNCPGNWRQQASHTSMNILERCQNDNIEFVLLRRKQPTSCSL